MDFRVISIGTLSHHPLWNETQPVRTPHATTVLIRSEEKTILVDPALPPEALAARLYERSGLTPERITDVFLTNFRPAHRQGLTAFEKANWWIAEQEREAVGVEMLRRFEAVDDEQTRQILREEIALMKRCSAAPDKLAERVDLFPLPGYTPGTCGLLLPMPRHTVLIASDAVATVEHLEQGRILDGAWDRKQATEALQEAVEIADWIVPGHDNLTLNPTRGPF